MKTAVVPKKQKRKVLKAPETDSSENGTITGFSGNQRNYRKQNKLHWMGKPMNYPDNIPHGALDGEADEPSG